MEEFIYHVRFNGWLPLADTGDNRADFFYTSLAAIYQQFTDAQIGCKLSNLYNTGVSKGTPYRGKLCTITREPLVRMKQVSSPTRGAKETE